MGGGGKPLFAAYVTITILSTVHKKREVLCWILISNPGDLHPSFCLPYGPIEPVAVGRPVRSDQMVNAHFLCWLLPRQTVEALYFSVVVQQLTVHTSMSPLHTPLSAGRKYSLVGLYLNIIWVHLHGGSEFSPLQRIYCFAFIYFIFIFILHKNVNSCFVQCLTEHTWTQLMSSVLQVYCICQVSNTVARVFSLPIHTQDQVNLGYIRTFSE